MDTSLTCIYAETLHTLQDLTHTNHSRVPIHWHTYRYMGPTYKPIHTYETTYDTYIQGTSGHYHPSFSFKKDRDDFFVIFFFLR